MTGVQTCALPICFPVTIEQAAPYGSGYKPLEERIAEALDKINEELCPAGKAYIKRRKAAGEKSSAYLSGRAVKVCKGQMSGKAKKKK